MNGYILSAYLFASTGTALLAIIRMDNMYNVNDSTDSIAEMRVTLNPFTILILGILMGLVWPLFWLIYAHVKIKEVIL